jgi:hypothetical protein
VSSKLSVRAPVGHGDTECHAWPHVLIMIRCTTSSYGGEVRGAEHEEIEERKERFELYCSTRSDYQYLSHNSLCLRRGGEVCEHRTARQRGPCEQSREYITTEQIAKEAIRLLKHKAIIFMNKSSKINACRRLLQNLVPHRHDVALSEEAYCVFTSPSASTDSTASWLSRVWTESLSKVTL